MKTRILTDTPEKAKLLELHLARSPKKQTRRKKPKCSVQAKSESVKVQESSESSSSDDSSSYSSSTDSESDDESLTNLCNDTSSDEDLALCHPAECDSMTTLPML